MLFPFSDQYTDVHNKEKYQIFERNMLVASNEKNRRMRCDFLLAIFIISRRIIFLANLWKTKSWLLMSCSIICFYIYHCGKIGEKTFRTSLPLILLYTHNYSVKTRENICQGVRNGGHVVSFDRCPRKCQFSCRLEDFHRRSPSALLFFGEDFFWSFQLSDRNRSSFQQRWIFWSWEAPRHHPEYTKASLTFNWFDKKTVFFLLSYFLLLFSKCLGR